MRAKTSNRIASLVSPCATTSRILTTPTLSPSTEVVVEMAKERWRVDIYDIMKGLIHVRSKKENSYETKNIVDGHLEVEKRLNSDLRRFEMVYQSENSLENRVDEHDLNITRLEEHNLTLKEIIFIIEDELGEFRQHVLCLQTEGIRLQDFNRDHVCPEKSVEDGGESDDNGDY
ncbi:hypothetical protein RYX36_002798 [Vicia faba]